MTDENDLYDENEDADVGFSEEDQVDQPDEEQLEVDGEEPEEESEEEQEPEPRQEEKPKKQKTRIGDRLSQVQRERYEAIAEAERLRAENERLRSLANTSTQTALEHYDRSVIQKVQAAKEQKIKALEIGDIHAQAEADIALSMATAEYQQLANMKAQHSYQQNAYPGNNQEMYYQQQQNNYPGDPRTIQTWVNDNQWLVPASEEYDDQMAKAVDSYCTEFDNNLYRAGRGHEIMSPEYFQIVDNYVNNLRSNRHKEVGGDLNMKPSRTVVSSVRGNSRSVGQPQAVGGSQEARLTREELQMAKNFGLEPKVYLQYKIREEQNMKERGMR